MLVRSLFLFLIYIFSANVVSAAQEYVPLAPLPGINSAGVDFSEYLAAIFNIGVGLASLLAVLMIVIGGVQYIIGAANPSVRGDAKKRITSAVFGLLLAFGSWLIVYTVNPNIIGGSFSISPATLPTSPTLPSQNPFSQIPIPTPSPSLPVQIILPTLPAPMPRTAPTVPPAEPVFTLSDPSNDYAIIRDCIGMQADAVCAPADIDPNGEIDGKDLSMFLETFKYDVNGNGVVNSGDAVPITYCSFKINTEPVPAPFCDDGDGVNNADGIDDRLNIPCGQVDTGAVPAFGIGCATDSYNDTEFGIDEFADFKQVLNASLDSTAAVDLRKLYTNLFNCNGGDCTYFGGNRVFANITYATMVNYDSSGDGIANFNTAESQKDFNGDGQINTKDDDFSDFLNENIFIAGQSPFIPFKFILGKMEGFLFDGAGFPDRQIIEYCLGKTPIMNCAMSDINGDFSVDSLDLTEFDNNSLKYDINSDGVVNTAIQ